MPHATAAYKFEFKVMGLARQLTIAWRGTDESDAFFMLLDPLGRVARCDFYDRRAPGWRDRIGGMRAEAHSYIFYDPFDAPEYYYVQWKGIPQPLMERLFSFRFEPDHLSVSAGASQRRAAVFSKFPHSHGVMI